MQEKQPPQAIITIRQDHKALVSPFIELIWGRLLHYTFEFNNDEPLGHSFSKELAQDYAELVSPDCNRHLVPQGLIPEVQQWIEEQGYQVTIDDRRQKSQFWVRKKNWKDKVDDRLLPLISAVKTNTDIRIVCRNLDEIANTIVAIAVTWFKARIAVGVPTHHHLRQITKCLRWRLPHEKLGQYTAKKKTPGRISVGLIHQLPLQKSNVPEFDLLLLPFAEQTVSKNAMERIMTTQFPRIVSFTAFRYSKDLMINLKLAVIAGTIFPPPEKSVPVTTVIMKTHGTRPKGQFENILAEKRELYWNNQRRNRCIAEVAKQLALGKQMAFRSVGIHDTGLLVLLEQAAKTGVAIVVESIPHAKVLGKLLPEWAIYQHENPSGIEPKQRGKLIITEFSAASMAISAGILIRATGTKFALPKIAWPMADKVDHGILIDFDDQYHPTASKNSETRIDSYLKNCSTLTPVKPIFKSKYLIIPPVENREKKDFLDNLPLFATHWIDYYRERE